MKGLAWASLALAFLALPLSAAFPSFAHGVEYLGVTPTRIRAEVEPGGSFHGQVNLVNLGSEGIRVSSAVRALHCTDSGMTLDISPQCGWVRVQGDDIEVPAGEIRAVDLRVRVPPGEAPETYHLALVFRREGVITEGMRLTPAVAVTLELVVLPPSESSNKGGSALLPLLLLGFTLALFWVLVLLFFKLGRRLWKG